ncbi:tetracycline resistance MFS efflux pump, partial [Xanthomonas oryzae pv. oryzae]
ACRARTGLVSLAGIAGPLLFANVFALFIGSGAPLHLPGAPWLLAGVLLAAGWGMAWKRAGRGTGTAAATQG